MSTSTIPAPKFNFLYPSTSLSGITSTSTRWQIMAALVAASDGAIIGRMRELPNGFLFIATVPGDEHSGAIYLYSSARRAFFMLDWEGRDDDFSVEEFDALVEAFSLDLTLAPGATLATPRPHHRGGHDRRHHSRSRSGAQINTLHPAQRVAQLAVA